MGEPVDQQPQSRSQSTYMAVRETPNLFGYFWDPSSFGRIRGPTWQDAKEQFPLVVKHLQLPCNYRRLVKKNKRGRNLTLC